MRLSAAGELEDWSVEFSPTSTLGLGLFKLRGTFFFRDSIVSSQVLYWNQQLSTLLRSVVKVARYIKFCQPSRLFWDFVLTLCVALALSGNYEWITTRRGQQCSAEPDKEGVQWTQGNIIIITCKDTCSVYRANTCTYHGISACVSFGRRSTRICRTLG